jgi:glutathione synthase/RimK-type ligase-like ATP-grasp enzyme
MMPKPLVVYSKADLRHTSALMRYSDLLDFAELYSHPIGDWSIAYMRCAHYTWNDELEYADGVEHCLRADGVRIINSVNNRICCQRKDYYYPILQCEGIPVPLFVHNPTIHEIRFMLLNGLSWPFIHRSSDGSRGRDAYLVYNEKEYHDADDSLIALGRRRISTKFIDSKGDRKYYIRRRAFVVFGRIDMWASDVSDNWNTQSDADKKVEDFIRENKTFMPPDKACEDAIRVGVALGLDIYTVDMVPDINTGTHYVVDVNPTYCASPIPGILPRKIREHMEGHFLRIANSLKHISNQR